MSDAPQRRQYFLVGRFAFPHLAHVIKVYHPQVIAPPAVRNEYCKGFLISIQVKSSYISCIICLCSISIHAIEDSPMHLDCH